MQPTDDDGNVPDDPQDELIAQIVPLRRRQDDTEQREQPHDEPKAAAQDTDDWSVFDPPEDLQLAERPRPDHAPGAHHDGDPPDDSLAGHAGVPRPRGRLVAFAGIALTIIVIAALAVLTLKGHAGASPRPPAPLRPNTALPATSGIQTVSQRPSPAPHRQSTSTQPSHRKTKRKPSPRSRALPQTATAGTPTGEKVSAGRSPGEPVATRTQSEPSSSSPTSTARGAGSEFGFER